MDYENIYDIALSYVQSLTTFEKIILFERYKTSENILNLKVGTLRSILGRNWSGSKFDKELLLQKAKEVLNYLKKTYTSIIRFDDTRYPYLLKFIPDYPFLIYCRGNINYDYNKSIAVVGTRNPDISGIERTQKIVKELTMNNFTIISGLAKGIDTTAHINCLNNKGKTIAVLGCGIDRIYPAVNKELSKKILNSDGAIISEYPPGINPDRWNFPRRNRIIVGLSKAVLIAQSPEKSGSLISAKLSADYNRDLFVCSYNHDSHNDSGNRNLIFTGAKEVNSGDDIINELSMYSIINFCFK